MPSAVGITSLTNIGVGLDALVALTGTPAGTLNFWIAQINDPTQAQLAQYLGDNGTYIVQVPHTGPWYVWPADDNGFGQEAAVWISYATSATGNNPSDLDACGNFLQGLITANQLLLNAAYQAVVPGATVKQIVYGRGSTVTESPAVIIGDPVCTARWDWVAMPHTKRWYYNISITSVIWHPDEASEIPAAVTLSNAIMEVLSLTYYEEVVLSTGLRVINCGVKQGRTIEQPPSEPGDGWLAMSSMEWSCDALKMNTGQFDNSFPP
jgi:hypothetical protein